MLLVTESKRKINQLGYDKKTQEYVYIHKGKEIWREKGDINLLTYFNEVRVGTRSIEDKKIENNPIWQKYCDSCSELEMKEWGLLK